MKKKIKNMKLYKNCLHFCSSYIKIIVIGGKPYCRSDFYFGEFFK